ncbi:helix-turn-helix domain-containing protein [Chordicoccus furentiruminis]|uniref:helix-turn-helix domain-containing protein n=1 Tax=Chordicoccus furentiruminis TaxID=2709410 RepID=UPI0023A8FC5E|nr:helix-turn-helix transcriptional regulator [Chordicoccus furentiruminis]
MPVNYNQLGDRIKHFREEKSFTQELLSEKLSLARENINRYENGSKHPSLDTVVDIANALGISVDDLLVDSLEHPISTADSEIHRLLLDCNKIEEQVLTKTVAELKKILYGLGI